MRHDRRVRNAIAVFVVCLLGCIPLPQHVSGASGPVDNPIQLTVDQVKQAQSTGCMIQDISGNADRDLATLLTWYEDKGITLRERKLPIPQGALVALPALLWLPPGFHDREAPRKVRSLAHEWGHYCREDENPDWRADWAASPGRWIEEVIGEAQEIRVATIQNVDPNVSPERVDGFRDFYKLWDIDPAQLEEASLMIWTEAMESAL